MNSFQIYPMQFASDEDIRMILDIRKSGAGKKSNV